MKLIQGMVALTLFVVYLGHGFAQARNLRATPPFSIGLKALSDRYKVGEPITLGITMTNTSQSTIGLITGPGMSNLESHFYVIAVGPGGKVAAERQYALLLHGKVPRPRSHNLGSGSSYMEAVLAGESVYHEIDANKLNDFSAPGTYDLFVERDYEADSSLLVKSNHIKIVVE